MRDGDIAYWVMYRQEMVCPACASDEEKSSPDSEVLTERDLRELDFSCFCNRCKKRLGGRQVKRDLRNQRGKNG